MDQFEFYKELYNTENERRAAVNDALSIPIAIVTALVSIAFYLLTTFDYGQGGWIRGTFIGLSIVSTILIAVSVYSLIRAFSDLIKGYEYKGVPYPQELFDWREDLVKYYTKYGNGVAQADEEYRKHLIKKFAEHADYNMRVNDRKTKHVFTAKRYMVLGLVCMALACFPFGYNYFHKAPDVHQVQVVTANSITNTKQNNERRETTTGPRTTTATTTASGQTDPGGQGPTTASPSTVTQADTTARP